MTQRPYSNRRRLTVAERAQLYGTMADCDRVWLDEDGRPVHTNLFKQFGLPTERESIRRIAERGVQGGRIGTQSPLV